MKYKYYIDLDERGEFFADVRNEAEQTIFEIKGFGMVEDGYMKHKEDLNGLKDYLLDIEKMRVEDTLTRGN